MVNTLWRLCPGFIVWNTWKERNKRIFQKEFKQLETIKTIIMNSLKETTLTTCKAKPDKMLTPNDSRILFLFGMDGSTSHKAQDSHLRPTHAPSAWLPPTSGFFKLNFYGASRATLARLGLEVSFEMTKVKSSTFTAERLGRLPTMKWNSQHWNRGCKSSSG